MRKRVHYPVANPATKSLEMKDTTSLVGAYYSGKSVLVTGATGFMGKVLVEKLLRSCHDVKTIYVCVRPKGGRSMQTRVEHLLKCKVFDRVREEWPRFHEKVKPISAEFTKPNLAISSEDLEELISEVNVIFHCAATVRFDEPLKDALLLNVLGTQQLLRLAHQMKNLEALIHVSTAYSNCNRRHIEEVFYPVPVEPKKLLDMMAWMDESLIEAITPNLIGDWPNTYTFSKALTEHLIQQEKGDLNVAIIRPSIVGASWQEPFPGWVDNFNGVSGLLVAAAKGILRSVKCNLAATADIIPVDLAINLIITAGWHTAVHRPKSPMIYNCTSGSLNPFSWGELEINVINIYEKNPLEKPFRIPNARMTSSYLLHQYWTFVCHTIPAFLGDLYLRLMGKKPWMMKLAGRLDKTMSLLEYFTRHSWDWSYENTNRLLKELNPKDRTLFCFDVCQLTWPEYMKDYCLGTKKYLLNEDMAGIPAARQHIRKLKTIQWALKATLLVIFWRVFIAKSQMARNIWYFVLSLCYKFLSYLRASSTLTH
ncbi:fatty acyl-CoA reductase 1-like [Protobothrops mucrosquamatus]|uniref:fatty acyl-CoA reductase 1-like n=1 Tax=Protobothrops mucrosquamatus TaxID=103944 RepID=UPI000775EB90|nr:fatty acyl-CoA reductase 1-like [Protobothrops mucrosquamatus]